jgi:hypothetical protein
MVETLIGEDEGSGRFPRARLLFENKILTVPRPDYTPITASFRGSS